MRRLTTRKKKIEKSIFERTYLRKYRMNFANSSLSFGTHVGLRLSRITTLVSRNDKYFKDLIYARKSSPSRFCARNAALCLHFPRKYVADTPRTPMMRYRGCAAPGRFLQVARRYLKSSGYKKDSRHGAFCIVWMLHTDAKVRLGFSVRFPFFFAKMDLSV